jgi:hypothetical protein
MHAFHRQHDTGERLHTLVDGERCHFIPVHGLDVHSAHGGFRSLLWSSSDQKGAFNVWQTEEAWYKYMVFGRAVRGTVLGYDTDEMVYPALRVIPMGWVLAVFLCQHIHRRLALQQAPAGAGFTSGSEWRRDAPRPLHGLLPDPWADVTFAWWQYTWMTLMPLSSFVMR